MAVKVKNVDDKLECFNSILQAQLKAVDVSLKASQTVFDQTKLRADEIISSAERSRARTSWFFGIVAAIVSLAAGFGLKQVTDPQGKCRQSP